MQQTIRQQSCSFFENKALIALTLKITYTISLNIIASDGTG